MDVIMSKATHKGKINIYGTCDNLNGGFLVVVGYEGKKKEKRQVNPRRTWFGDDHSFTFDKTEWFLDYDFNLKFDGECGEFIEEAAANDNEMHPVFVYGTLRKNMRNHDLLEDMYSRGEKAITQGIMYHNGSYPYLYEGDKVAHGELYYLKEKAYKRVMMRLDGLEGYYGKGDRHNHYNRELVDVALLNGEIVKAWCYFTNDTRALKYLTLITDGDFVRWAKEYSPGKFDRGMWD